MAAGLLHQRPTARSPGAWLSGTGICAPTRVSHPGLCAAAPYGEEHGYRERCEGLRHEEHELRDRLAYTPYGEERERLQYRLGRVQAERERCRHP